eukprot:scaffold3967_cov179-Amphora_coffeaeformis.AAC.1
MNRRTNSTTWEAANVVKRSRHHANTTSPRRSMVSPSRQAADKATLEATLNRLSKAYNTAMECIGALHRADNTTTAATTTTTTTDTTNTPTTTTQQQDKLDILRQVSRVARQTLEQGILIDPLVRPPVWTAGCLQQQQKQQPSSWTLSSSVSATAAEWTQLSQQQQSTVQHMAYLALTNYADLLQCCAAAVEPEPSQHHNNYDMTTLLDRGIVKRLKSLPGDTCCWSDDDNTNDMPDVATAANATATTDNRQPSTALHHHETPVQTWQLVVWALLDATALDGSDPLVWLKLACACRRLGRIQQQSQQQSNQPRRYRVLERYALEQGIACRPTAPNRLVVQAYREWQSQIMDDPNQYSHVLAPPLPTIQQHLELPRYSWAVLGRMLLRACRGGGILEHSSNSDAHHYSDGVSSLGLSPLLALPTDAVLKTVVSFLDPRAYAQLKQVCRTLSMLQFTATTPKQVAPALATVVAEPEAPATAPEAPAPAAVPPPPQPLTKTSKSTSATSKESAQGSRVSKRLRSQIIHSGKRAERSQRRSSVDYCVHAIVLGTAPSSSLKAGGEEDPSHSNKKKASPEPSLINPPTQQRTKAVVPEKELHRLEAAERLGPASLTAFIHGTKPAAPLSLLFHYVAHVSIFAAQVFANDHHGTIVLLSSVTDCFDLMLKRTRSYQGLTLSWSTRDLQVPAVMAADQIWALDLLHAELRFKRCDREEHQYVTDGVDFDSDANIVEVLLPMLGTLLKQTPNTSIPLQEWNALQVRYHWLVAGYYLWRSRISHDVAESREAEREGLGLIKDIIRLMGEFKITRVRTPHLEGIGRPGEIWKELSVASLTAFQNKVQASSVVLKAQEQFIDAVSNLADKEGDLVENEVQRFVSIASYLLERYSSPVDSSDSNYVELLDDFMGVHGTSTFSFSLDDGAMAMRQWFESVVPTHLIDREVLKSMTEPCILSILLSCSQLHGKSNQILCLLVNLIRTLERYQQKFLESTKGDRRYLEDDPHADAMSDDFSMMSDDEGPDLGGLSTLFGYARLLGLLVESLETVFEKTDAPTKAEFLSSSDLTNAVGEIFKFCANLPSVAGRNNSSVQEAFETSATQFILERMTSLLKTLDGALSDSSTQRKRLHVGGLVSVLMRQDESLKTLLKAPSHQKTRLSWKSQMTSLAREIGYACLSLGYLFSDDLARVEDGNLIPSPLLKEAGIPIERLKSALLSLFHFSRSKFKDVGVQDLLLSPVAAALIGFCGSASFTNPKGEIGVTLTDFVDSDESAAEWCEDEEDEDEDQSKYGQILRVVTQIVQLVQLTIGTTEDRQISKYPWFKGYVTEHGPLLPLIACRVLSFCSDTLLKEFPGDEDSGVGLKSSLWSEYSVGTRKVGTLLDSLLYKVYRCLYGFNLSSSADIHKDGTSTLAIESNQTMILPEGVRAAAQLYRCVMRASGFGRKTVPKTALDTIQAALPEFEGSSRAQKLRECLFDAKSDGFDLKGLVSVAQKASSWETYFKDVSECLEISSYDDEASIDDESSLIRQGIAHLIAQGPLPHYQESPDTDARVESASVENELARKFDALLFELSYGNGANCKNWVKAAQCCWTKADMIADRIGKQKKFVHCPDFVVKGPMPCHPEGRALSDLVARQEQEDGLRLVGWTEIMGHDLSVFMDHCWSSLESLKDCSRALETQFKSSTDHIEEMSDSIQTYEEVTRLFRNKEFDMWQHSWGGLFVSSLRILARRCMAIALYVSYKELDRTIEPGDNRLSAEICESLGTFMYSEVSGSQIYGYPMRSLTQNRKRKFADLAATFYGEALSLQKNRPPKDKATVSADWDILFMIGKCHEKIASTYSDETFANGTENQSGMRRFEHHMNIAIQSYSKSLEHGLLLEKDGALIAEQQGGSGHGATEVQYRLHATRLKCLINALKRNPSEREVAEQEALRLIEQDWYTKSVPHITGNVRDRTWNVLMDVVDAMIQCRSEYSCFHRSVYRHAQALLWAPIVCDPSQPEGSFGVVPGSRAYKLRGLNSGSAIESASSVIGSLFDRRRAQLCAVWVTQGASEAFEQINVSVRKYDALRGKYIAAYLETLELGHRKNDLETFWRWLSSSTRDLPSYMQITCQPSPPGFNNRKNHMNDCLLVLSRPYACHHFLADVKRRTNAAMASVILHETQNHKANAKVTDSHLKQAYSCFLRLNCDSTELHRTRVRKASSVKPIIDALVAAYVQLVPKEEQREKQQQNMLGDWSFDAQQNRMLDLAMEKCHELFPTLSNTFLSSRKTTGPKKKRGAPGESETQQQVFRVSVPEGLAEGDTFLTEITVGETKKRLRLTVPKGGATTLRFTLDVPKADEGRPAKQQKTAASSSVFI